LSTGQQACAGLALFLPFVPGAVIRKGIVGSEVRFAQKGVSSTFRYGEFAGKTVDEVVAGLKSGAIQPDQLPIQVVVRDGRVAGVGVFGNPGEP
jgi:hypothetical protein